MSARTFAAWLGFRRSALGSVSFLSTDMLDQPTQHVPDEPDLLQRHLLCRATGLHDPRPDGTCRDCETVVGDAPICRSES